MAESSFSQLKQPVQPPEDVERFVDALLRVDPKGLSGKHRREDSEDQDGDELASE
ncbi:MAG: hypothetical protein ACLQNG_02770 [Acidimicrobiales bacterium]